MLTFCLGYAISGPGHQHKIATQETAARSLRELALTSNNVAVVSNEPTPIFVVSVTLSVSLSSVASIFLISQLAIRQRNRGCRNEKWKPCWYLSDTIQELHHYFVPGKLSTNHCAFRFWIVYTTEPYERSQIFVRSSGFCIRTRRLATLYSR